MSAFEELYYSCFPQVAKMVKALGGNQVDAEDIFQDSLLVFYEKTLAGTLQIEASPTAYIMGIAKHLWIKQRRKNSHLLSLNEAEEKMNFSTQAFSPPPPPKLRLFRLLAFVGRKCMELLQAVYYQGYSAAQLADDFGFKTARSATVQKFKCLEKLRTQVQQKKLSYEEVVE